MHKFLSLSIQIHPSCVSSSEQMTEGHCVEWKLSIHESLSKPPDRETTRENKPEESGGGGGGGTAEMSV